jgi:glutamate--cysteine ligase
MVAKFRTSLALQPVATALFANSPFKEGKPTGLVSTRANVWTDTDADRTGMLDFVFQDGFGFETYARYALDVPMYFVKRGDRYIDVAGQSFRDLMAGKLPGLPGERASVSDWANHVSTIFPEVRLKRYLEMRGSDSGPWRHLPALSAFWVGLLYDQASLDAAWDIVKDWTAAERQKLRDDVPRLGFRAEIRGRNMLTLAQEVLRLSTRGLARRQRLDRNGRDETRYLRPLEESIARGITPAEELLEKYHGAWNGSVEPIFEEYAY